MKVNMHSHERTLLASLGFADADKRDRRHDLACQYLSQSENARALVQLFVDSIDPEPFEEDVKHGYGPVVIEREGSRQFIIKDQPRVTTEFPVTKGEGQYKTTVGFLDVVIRDWLKLENVFMERRRTYETQPWGEWISRTQEIDLPRAVLVEVKITPVGAGDIIRQINLYREFLPERNQDNTKRPWVVATAFQMTHGDVDQFKAVDITHVRLGEKFDQFVEQQRQLKPAPCESVTI